jgi:glycogen(starch) synthase
VQASAYEGYGRTLVEAALARVPIVTSTVGVVGELFVPGEDVLSFPPGDVGALTSALEQIIEDERLRIMLPMQALHKAKTHIASFTDQPRRIAEDLAQVLKKA